MQFRNRVRHLLLVPTTAASSAMWFYGERRELPDWPAPFDMNEHSAHLVPGMMIGLGARIGAELLHLGRRASIAAGIGTTAVIGSIFETGAFDTVYRNTTHSFADAAWTTLAGVIGTFVVRTPQSQPGEQLDSKPTSP